jgi:uncharacterized protein YceK
MKKYTVLLTLVALLSLGGCTQVVTAPIRVAGAAVGATLDVAGAAGGAVVNTVTGGD